MIQGQLHAIFALLPHNNMPFVQSVISGLDFMADRLSFWVSSFYQVIHAKSLKLERNTYHWFVSTVTFLQVLHTIETM